MLVLCIYCTTFTKKFDLTKSYTYTFLEFFLSRLLSLLFGGNLVKTLNFLINVTRVIHKKEVMSVTCKLYVILISSGLLWILNARLINNYNLWIAIFTNVYVTVSYISNIIVIDVLYNCMRYLRKSFDHEILSTNFIGKDIVNNVIVKLNNNTTVYKHIIDFIDNIDSEIHIWVILSFYMNKLLILNYVSPTIHC